jgi:hypothetical protein
VCDQVSKHVNTSVKNGGIATVVKCRCERVKERVSFVRHKYAPLVSNNNITRLERLSNVVSDRL